MTDNINHPAHYTQGFETRPIECIDITQHMGFCNGNAFKYVWRAGKKGGREQVVEDLEKAKWYLERIQDHGNFRGDLKSIISTFFLIERPPTVTFGVGLTEHMRYQILLSIATDFIGDAIVEIEHVLSVEKRHLEGYNKGGDR